MCTPGKNGDVPGKKRDAALHFSSLGAKLIMYIVFYFGVKEG